MFDYRPTSAFHPHAIYNLFGGLAFVGSCNITFSKMVSLSQTSVIGHRRFEIYTFCEPLWFFVLWRSMIHFYVTPKRSCGFFFRQDMCRTSVFDLFKIWNDTLYWLEEGQVKWQLGFLVLPVVDLVMTCLSSFFARSPGRGGNSNSNCSRQCCSCERIKIVPDVIWNQEWLN